MRVKYMTGLTLVLLTIAGCNSFNRTEIHGSINVGAGYDSHHGNTQMRGMRVAPSLLPSSESLAQNVSSEVNKIINKWNAVQPAPVTQVVSVRCTYKAPAWPDPPELPILQAETFDEQIEGHLRDLRQFIADRKRDDLKAQKDYRLRCGVK